MRVTIVTNGASNSARNLQNALIANGVENNRAHSTLSRRCRGDRYVINLGVSAPLHGFRQRVLHLSNPLEAVRNCSNKIRTFEHLALHHVPTLEFSVGNPVVALGWLEHDGKIVVRHTVTGHSGAGIQIVRRNEPLPAMPLYTRYFRKQAEYRVHVAFGDVILIQQKRKRNDAEMEGNSNLIRTHANGWVFTTQRLSCDSRGYTDRLRRLALAAANAVGINHGAVDILVNHDLLEEYNRLANTELGLNGQFDEYMFLNPDIVVCEINSAPGLEADSTLAAYTNAFINDIRRHGT